jgi:hypothetical protein
MIAIPISGVKAEQAKLKAAIDIQWSEGLQNLHDLHNHASHDPAFSAAEITYLANIIQEFNKPDFLLFEPDELDLIMKRIGLAPDPPAGTKREKISKHIQRALKFRKLRGSFYPKYFHKIGVKSCVYCNSQLTITINRKRVGSKARFDVDHSRSQDKYPLLCISLFNLYPACASCNRVKSNRVIAFELYAHNPKKTYNRFVFELDPISESLFLNKGDVSDLKITFRDTLSLPSGTHPFKDSLYIQEVYETQKDVAGELIHRVKMYNRTYQATLKKSFPGLTLTPEDFKRAVVGNYVSDGEIHKRPLSKLAIDLARHLGFLDPL